jgi:uncharacterized protein (DUF1015 family)
MGPLEPVTGYVLDPHRTPDPATLAEVLPPRGTPSDAQLHRARAALARLLDGDGYRPLDAPCLLVLEIDDGRHRAVSVVGDLAMAAFDDGTVLPHEQVDPDRVATLRRHLEVVGAVSTPVSLAHRDDEWLDEVVAELTAGPPDTRLVAGDDRTSLWIVEEERACRRLAEAVAATDGWLIADGHHRAAAGHVAGRVLVALTPDRALTTRPFHRRVEITRPAVAVDLLREHGLAVAALAGPALPTGPGEVVLAVDDRWWRVALPPAGTDAHARLDVVRAEAEVLAPLAATLGTGAPPRPIAPDDDPSRLPADGTATVLLHPPTLAEVRLVAAAGRTLPPKSTYVVPKHRPGLLVVPRGTDLS